METTLIKKITPNNVMRLFDDYRDIINIRHYEPKNNKRIDDFNEKKYYDITIRHNEDDRAVDILNNAIKRLN